jgi:hypothetical protein
MIPEGYLSDTRWVSQEFFSIFFQKWTLGFTETESLHPVFLKPGDHNTITL